MRSFRAYAHPIPALLIFTFLNFFVHISGHAKCAKPPWNYPYNRVRIIAVKPNQHGFCLATLQTKTYQVDAFLLKDLNWIKRPCPKQGTFLTGILEKSPPGCGDLLYMRSKKSNRLSTWYYLNLLKSEEYQSYIDKKKSAFKKLRPQKALGKRLSPDNGLRGALGGKTRFRTSSTQFMKLQSLPEKAGGYSMRQASYLTHQLKILTKACTLPNVESNVAKKIMIVRITVSKDGKVSDLKTENSFDQKQSNCIKKVISSFKFPTTLNQVSQRLSFSLQ